MFALRIPTDKNKHMERKYNINKIIIILCKYVRYYFQTRIIIIDNDKYTM